MLSYLKLKKTLTKHIKWALDIGQQATQDSDPQEKEHKWDEPFDHPVCCLELLPGVARLQCRQR